MLPAWQHCSWQLKQHDRNGSLWHGRAEHAGAVPLDINNSVGKSNSATHLRSLEEINATKAVLITIATIRVSLILVLRLFLFCACKCL